MIFLSIVVNLAVGLFVAAAYLIFCTLIGFATYKLGFSYFIIPEKDKTIKLFEYTAQGFFIGWGLFIVFLVGVFVLHLISLK
jgi:hypothetical protein